MARAEAGSRLVSRRSSVAAVVCCGRIYALLTSDNLKRAVDIGAALPSQAMTPRADASTATLAAIEWVAEGGVAPSDPLTRARRLAQSGLGRSSKPCGASATVANLRITAVRAREILDSRGRPTVEADVALAGGALGRASVPSGASTGRHEAVELRDGDPRRYRGLGVLRAVENVAHEIAPALLNRSADDQHAVDDVMVALDGTGRKARLGANATLAVSLATCRAAAIGRGIPLYRHIADLAGVTPTIPLPMVNIIGGGLHAGRQIEIQDVLAISLAPARSLRRSRQLL